MLGVRLFLFLKLKPAFFAGEQASRSLRSFRWRHLVYCKIVYGTAEFTFTGTALLQLFFDGHYI